MAASKDIDRQDEPRGESKLRWVLGWIVLPGTIIAALFLTGVHLGARHPDMGLSRLLLWMFKAEAGVAAPSSATKSEPRSGAEPGEPFRYGELLTGKQLEAIADKSLGLGVAELDCDYVCRVYSKAQHQLAVYSVETCTLARARASGPALLACSGKLEAPKTQPATEPEAKPDGD